MQRHYKFFRSSFILGMAFAVAGVFLVPSAQAHVAIQGNFVNNGAAGGNIVGGRTNILALDVTLPAADQDTFLDGDGSDSTAAGAQEGPPANGTALIRFATAENVCVTDADGGAVTPPVTRIWVEAAGVNEANCGADNETEVNILGAAGGVGSALDTGVGASTRREVVHRENVAANGAYNRTGDADATNDEDIYLDEDESLFYNAGPLDALTVRNTGTAVTVTDILTVQLWTENAAPAATFSTADLNLDTNCAWDGVDDWVCEGVNPGDTLVLYTGLVAPRIYVTIDTALSPTVNRTVQMQIPVLIDGNANGNFDAGDAGVIFSNDTANNGLHDGPPGAVLTNANVMTFIGSSSGGGTTTTPPADSPPPAPSTIVATGGAGKVDLTWTNTLEADFASVKIYRSTTSGTLGTAIVSGLIGTTHSDTTVIAGTTYYYTVRSVDRGGNESTNTAQVSATPTAGTTTSPPPPSTAPPSGQVTPESSTVANGDLIRASNTVEVYVTKKVGALVIIRHIVNPRIFDIYGHFGGVAAWSKVVGVNSLGTAKASAWVRGSDGKVWEVNGDGTRHHMQMTWGEFASRVAAGDSQLAQNLIFEVNAAELSLYAAGAVVLP